MINWNDIGTSLIVALTGGAIYWLFSTVIGLKMSVKRNKYDIDAAFEKIRKYHPDEAFLRRKK